MKAQYIVFEGPDYAGKTTMLEHAKQYLTLKNIPTEIHPQPGATKIGQQLREITKYSNINIDHTTEQILFAADFSAFIHEILQPKLTQGTTILSDRSNFVSGWVYGTAGGVNQDDTLTMHQINMRQEISKADYLIVLTLPTTQMLERMKLTNRKLDKFESRQTEFLDKICKLYELIGKNGTKENKLIKERYTTNIITIDASQDKEQVKEQITSVMEAITTLAELRDEKSHYIIEKNYTSRIPELGLDISTMLCIGATAPNNPDNKTRITPKNECFRGYDGKTYWYECKRDKHSSVLKPLYKDTTITYRECISIKTYCDKEKIQPDGIAIDAQGADLEILKGAGDLADVKCVVLEIIYDKKYDGQCNFVEVDQFMRSNGFELDSVHKPNKWYGNHLYIRKS